MASLIKASRVGGRFIPSTRILSSRIAFNRGITTLKYTEAHEWISFDSETSLGTMGITDYAQNSLGDVVFVELPEAGAKVEQKDQIGAVESVKAASDIYAPISGTIAEINELLNDKPGLLNKSPEKDGWLCKIKVDDKGELEALMNAEAYKKHCEGEGDEH